MGYRAYREVARTARSEPKRKTNVRFNRRGAVGHSLENGSWPEAGEVECDDGVGPGSPANLDISLIAEIAGVAGAAWIDQGSTPKCATHLRVGWIERESTARRSLDVSHQRRGIVSSLRWCESATLSVANGYVNDDVWGGDVHRRHVAGDRRRTADGSAGDKHLNCSKHGTHRWTSACYLLLDLTERINQS